MKRFLLTLWVLCCLIGCGSESTAAVLVQSPNGTYIAKTTLAAAATAADAAGKTVVVTTPQVVTTAIAWPSDRELRFEKGGYVTFTGAGALTGLKEARPEWFGAVGNGVTNDTVAVGKAYAAADTVYLAKDYFVTTVSSAKAVRLKGPGKVQNATVNAQLLAFTSGTESGAEVTGAKLGPMPAGSTDDFAAVYFEDAKHPIVTFNEITNPNTGIRFGYTTGDRTIDGLVLGNHIADSKQMGVENINSDYNRIIGNSFVNSGEDQGIHGVRVSGDSKGVVTGLNTFRNKRNAMSYQIGGLHSIAVGNYVEQPLSGYEDSATELMEGHHVISATVVKDATSHAFDIDRGQGYRIDGLVHGGGGQGLITSTVETDGKHRIDLSMFGTASTSLNLRNGKNLVTVIVDGTVGGTPVSISGSNNLVLVVVTNTALTNTVYVTGSNNTVIINDSASGTVGLRIDGSGNTVYGNVTGSISLNGDSNVLNVSGTMLTIGAGADNNKVSGKFSSTITDNGARNDLTGIYEYNLILVSAVPVTGLFPRKVRLENTSNVVGQPKGWRITTVGGAHSGTRANNTAYATGVWMKWSSGNTVWECTTGGTSDGSAPDIVGKAIGDTVTDGTAVWTLRSLTAATVASEGDL